MQYDWLITVTPKTARDFVILAAMNFSLSFLVDNEKVHGNLRSSHVSGTQ